MTTRVEAPTDNGIGVNRPTGVLPAVCEEDRIPCAGVPLYVPVAYAPPRQGYASWAPLALHQL
ncbi:hypothetical protein GCM10009574_024840 [Streptomyces asiaticus]|uniref:Uncharacterized protein n=2 Tax=Streptomyces rhizosphaericus TaxID=114699 RepID=A0ABN1RZT3_9ACTN